MAEADIRRLIFLQVKVNAKELTDNLRVSSSTVKEVNALIAQAPKGAKDEDIAQGVFNYLKNNNLFTAKGDMKSISARGSATSILKNVEQAKAKREAEEEKAKLQETKPKKEKEIEPETAQSSAASTPRTPATVAEAEKRYDPTRVMGAMASIAAKDRAYTIAEIKKQELLREAAEEQIVGDIARFREEQKQTKAIIDQKAKKMHARQTGGTKRTVAEITASLRAKAVENKTLKEDPVKAEEEIISKIIAESQQKGLDQRTFITIPDPLTPEQKEQVKALSQQADREAKKLAESEKSQEEIQAANYAKALAAKKDAVARRKAEAAKKKEVENEDARSAVVADADQTIAATIAAEAKIRQGMVDALTAAHKADQQAQRHGVSDEETARRADIVSAADLEKEFEAFSKKTAAMTKQETEKKEKAKEIAEEAAAHVHKKEQQKLEAETAKKAQWQEEGRERLDKASQEIKAQLRKSVSAGTTFGFGGYQARRDATIDALTDKYCEELAKNNKAMEVLVEEEYKPFVSGNLERMAPKIAAFCEKHKNDQRAEFEDSMQRMTTTTAEHFAETSKVAMSSGREIPKGYGEATPAGVLTKSIETRYGASVVTPHTKKEKKEQRNI